MTDTDFILQDLHAKFHDEHGNLLGEYDCEWEKCQFWAAAEFVFTESTPVLLRLSKDDALTIGAKAAANEWNRRRDEMIEATASDHAYALVKAAYDAVQDAAYDTEPTVLLATAPGTETS